MRAFILLVISSLNFISCKSGGDADITFKNVYNLQVKGLNKKKGEIHALLAFKNDLANIDFRLKEVNLDILVDGIDVGTYYSKSTYHVKAQSEVKIPVEYYIDNQKLQNSDGEYPSSFVVKLEGYAVFTDAQGNEVKVNVNHQETAHPIINKKEKREGQSISSEDKNLKKSDVRKLRRKEKKLEKELKELSDEV